MLTREEMQALKAPFELNLHTVREGFRMWKSEDADIRWFTYLDWWAVRQRLDDVFGSEWETPEPKTQLVGNTVLAIAGITIRGLTRWYSGAGETTADDAKGAVTDALRRAAAQWGIAEYCYNTDLLLRTNTYKVLNKDGKWATDWDLKDTRQDEAYQQFTRWYNKRFKSVGITTVAGPPPQAQKPAVVTPQAATNGENGGSDATPTWFTTPLQTSFGVFKTYVLTHLYNKNTWHMNGSLKKHGIVVNDNIAPEWATKSAGEVITFLETRHDETDQLPEAM